MKSFTTKCASATVAWVVCLCVLSSSPALAPSQRALLSLLLDCCYSPHEMPLVRTRDNEYRVYAALTDWAHER